MCHEGIASLFLTLALDGGEWLQHTPAVSPQRTIFNAANNGQNFR
jgi:hypothetical protein